MIIAWVLSLIAIIATAIGHLEHSAALQIRLLAMEQEAHAAFMAAEKNLHQCESQFGNAVPLAVPNTKDDSTACNVTVVDANATGELIRIRAAGNAKQKYSTPLNRIQTKQIQLESMVYRNKRDHTIERLSWRVLWSITQSEQKSH